MNKQTLLGKCGHIEIVKEEFVLAQEICPGECF